MKEKLIGHWREARAGKTLDALEPVDAMEAWAFVFRADGTADLRYGDSPWVSDDEESPAAPFPITWEVTNEHTVSIWTPVPPQPAGAEWSREALTFDVLAVTDGTVTLTEQPHGGDFIALFQRVAAP